MTRVALFGCGWIQDFHARGLAHAPSWSRSRTTARARGGLRREVRHPAGDDRLGGARGRPRRGRGRRCHAERPACAPGVALLRAASTCSSRSRWRRASPRRRDDRGVASAPGVADGGSLLAVPRRGDAMRDRIMAGELGEIVKTRGLRRARGLGSERLVHRSGLAGGGALVDMGVHAIDTARFLLGDPEPGGGLRRGRHPVRRGALRGGRRRAPLIRWSNGTTASSSPAGGSRTWAGSRPTPRSTAPGDTPGSGPRGALPRTTSTAHSRCTRPRWRSSWTRSKRAGSPARGEDGRVVMQVVEAAYRSAADRALDG